MVVDFAVVVGLWQWILVCFVVDCGSMVVWLDFVRIPPLVADPLSSVPHSRQPKPWVSPCSMWVLGLMIYGFDGGGFWLW